MNNFCQIWNEEPACSHNPFPASCDNANHWKCTGFCHCPECRNHISGNQASASDYNAGCYCCENCQCFHNNESAEQDNLTSTYNERPNDYNLNEAYMQEYKHETQYLYGKYDLEINKNYHIDPSSGRINPSTYKPKYDVRSNDTHPRNSTDTNLYNNSRKGNVQMYNVPFILKSNDEINQPPLNCDICVAQSKSDSKLNNKNNTSGTAITRNSFYSCAPCDSNQIQMMYENKKQSISKSTINQNSIQTIASKTSKLNFKRTILEKKYRKKIINSGYFEFISPTNPSTRSVLEKTSASISSNNYSTISTHSSKDAGRYGYFEIKERNYEDNEKHQPKKVSFSELDKIPTKISKEVDTSHFKKSTMLDKCLSANIKKSFIKTSDKSLSVNILKDKHLLTLSDVLKVVNKMPKQSLETKRSNKVLESISAKSLTHFKPTILNKPSVTKQKSSINNVRKKITTIKSLSEGSVKVSKLASSKLYSMKEHVDNGKDLMAGYYRGYLERALDKLETQISNKIEQALVTYAGLSKNKQLLNIYNSTVDNPVQISPDNEARSILNSNRNEIGTNPSITMETLEDVIDSEEVEIDTNDLEERSSLSSHPNSNEIKMYNSDVSSHNTEKTSIDCLLDTTENFQKKENIVELDRKQINSVGKNNKIRISKISKLENDIYKEEPTCKLAIMSHGSIHQENNMKEDYPENSSNKIDSRLKLHNTKTIDSKKPATGSENEVKRSLTQDNLLGKRQTSRHGSDNRCSRSSLSHKQGSDGKSYGSRNKNIKFRQTSLGTIEEESRSCLDLISDIEENDSASDTAILISGDSTLRVWDGYKEENPYKSSTSRNSYDTHTPSFHKGKKASHKPASKYHNNARSSRHFSDQHFSQPDYLKSEGAFTGYPIGMNFYENDSCCVRQTCKDCPKKRYYAEVLQSFNEKRIRHYNEHRNEDQLYEYMLNVPLFNDKYGYTNGQCHLDYQHIKLLNMISFVIFIIMFYGVFQFINCNII